MGDEERALKDELERREAEGQRVVRWEQAADHSRLHHSAHPPGTYGGRVPGRAHTDEQKRAVLDRLCAVWLAYPELRLGQLLANGLLLHEDRTPTDHSRKLFYVEDALLVEALEQWKP